MDLGQKRRRSCVPTDRSLIQRDRENVDPHRYTTSELIFPSTKHVGDGVNDFFFNKWYLKETNNKDTPPLSKPPLGWHWFVYSCYYYIVVVEPYSDPTTHHSTSLKRIVDSNPRDKTVSLDLKIESFFGECKRNRNAITHVTLKSIIDNPLSDQRSIEDFYPPCPWLENEKDF